MKKVKKNRKEQLPAEKKENNRQNVPNWIIAISGTIVAIVELVRFIIDIINR